MSKPRPMAYSAAGVDTKREDTALGRLTARLKETWPQTPGVGHVELDFGYFANVIDMGPFGLAITADYVGTFFDAYLKGRSGARLQALERKYPEVRIQ